MDESNTLEFEALQKRLASKSEVEALRFLAESFPDKVVFSTSLGYEDQVITDMIFSHHLPIGVFTLDTGRLFKETYSTLDETRAFYKKEIAVFFPDTKSVETLLTKKGALSFYESVDNRKECCHIRKVEPLGRALKGKKIWITGLRAAQSLNRAMISSNLEWDVSHSVFKFYPIFDWSFDKVKQYVKDHRVPYNSLHDKGFPSIGCQPCTRAARAGSDFRSGRWWWESGSQKECGIHEKTY